MSFSMESGLSMLARIRGSAVLPHLDSISESDKVIVLDLNSNEPFAARLYTYFLVRDALREPVTHHKPDCFRVLIFDGRCWFQENQFINHFTAQPELLEQVKLFRAVDESILLMHLHEQLKTNLALNLNLKLVVIIANSSILFPEIVDKLNRLLFSLSLSVRILLVVDRLSKKQIEFYSQKSMICDMVRCKLVPCQSDSNSNTATLQLVGHRSDSTVIERTIQLK